MWLLSRLFDFAFSRFLATNLIRILYVVLMIAGLAGIGFGLIKVFQLTDQTTAYLCVGLSPLAYVIYLIVIRLVCETLIVLFAIAEDLDDIRRQLSERAADFEDATYTDKAGQP